MINTLRSSRNGLLRRLPEETLDRIEPHFEPTTIEPGQCLGAPGKKLGEIWFPESGFASVLVGDPRQTRVEVGLIGREGVIGYMTALGLTHSIHYVLVQQEGAAHVVPSEKRRAVLEMAPELNALIARFAAVMMIQVGDTASANARGRVVERLARWLLMAHDRCDGDTLYLVHRYLAEMLAVRRAGVTDALHALEGEGFIKAERGRITIRDRGGLSRVARGYYGLVEQSYAQIMGAEDNFPVEAQA